jgi:hypothetical protein
VLASQTDLVLGVAEKPTTRQQRSQKLDLRDSSQNREGIHQWVDTSLTQQVAVDEAQVPRASVRQLKKLPVQGQMQQK